MPITRRDETSDPLDQYVALLWHAKWLILGMAIAATVITYVVLLFVPEKYKVTSELFVSRLSTVQDEETPSPETVTALLKSQSVIEEVRNDFTRAFGLEQPPKLERFAKQFKVKSTVLQDTTVRKQISPVLELQVESKGTSETRFIMDSWIRNFVEQYGNFNTEEARLKRDAYIQEKAKIETAISKVEQERATYDARLPYLKKVLAEKLDLLTPSRLLFQDQDVDTIKLDFQIQNPRTRPGLYERYAELKLVMAVGTPSTTAAAELAAIENAIGDAKTSIAEAEQGLADARFKQLQTQRHLDLLKENQKAINDAVSKFTVASAIRNDASINGLPVGADVRALSTPITPETRVWPKRTLTAALVGAAVAILTIFVILARNFLTKVSATYMQ